MQTGRNHMHTKFGSRVTFPSGKARGHLKILWELLSIVTQRPSSTFPCGLKSPAMILKWRRGTSGNWIIFRRKCSIISWSCLNLYSSKESSNFGLQWLNLRFCSFYFVFIGVFQSTGNVFFLQLFNKLTFTKTYFRKMRS